ncbi:MAG: hypothetical protein IJV35_04035 [Neisseriaceae bacterium]|nr:hypothetical protein [Neisseriaceae bacterium]
MYKKSVLQRLRRWLKICDFQLDCHDLNFSFKSRNDTAVSDKTANACLSARNDDTNFRQPENIDF